MILFCFALRLKREDPAAEALRSRILFAYKDIRFPGLFDPAVPISALGVLQKGPEGEGRIVLLGEQDKKGSIHMVVLQRELAQSGREGANQMIAGKGASHAAGGQAVRRYQLRQLHFDLGDETLPRKKLVGTLSQVISRGEQKKIQILKPGKGGLGAVRAQMARRDNILPAEGGV